MGFTHILNNMAKINHKEKKFTIMFKATGDDVNIAHTAITKKLIKTGDRNFSWANFITNMFVLSCYENSTWDHMNLTDEIRKVTNIPFIVTEIKDGHIQGWTDPDFWKWWDKQKNRTQTKLNKDRREKLLKIKKISEDKIAEKVRLVNLAIREKELVRKKELLAIKQKKQIEEQKIRLEEQKIERELYELNKLNNPEPDPIPVMEEVVYEVVYEEVKTSFWKKYFNF